MNKIYLHIITSIAIIGIACCNCKHKLSVMPNVVIVLTDDQGWGDVGYNGNEIIETPTLDSLANNSVVLNRFYVSPVCAPTRASLLTGKYNISTGATWVTHRKEVMRDTEITIAEILKENGYRTACFGKWHNGQQFPNNPNGQGFETFFGFCAGHWNNYFDTDLQYNGKFAKTKGYITDVITDSVVSFIKNTKEPFLAYVAYNTPHTPYQVADEYFEKYKSKNLDDKTAAIYGMCENIDDNVKRIQSTLKKYDKHKNTIFVFLSDNGPNYVRYNGGYKGRKALVDEGGVRVPFIIDFPNGNFAERIIRKQFAAHIDLLPTLLDLCDINYAMNAFDGHSFADLLVDSKVVLKDRKFYSHQVLDSTYFAASIRTNDYLLTCYPWDTALFNLTNDPFQIQNLLHKEKAVAKNLKHDLEAWLIVNNYRNVKTEPIQVGYAEATTVELPAHECSVLQNAEFAEGMGWANDYTVNWDSCGARIAWPVNVVSKGNYKASLQYVCNGDARGANFSLKFKDAIVDFTIDSVKHKKFIQSPDRVKRVEAYEIDWLTQPIGTLSLKEGSAALNLIYNGNINTNLEIKGILLERILNN